MGAGPWRRGWADVTRKMEIGTSLEVSSERDMRSLIQTIRTCGFRSKARKKADGGYAVTKLGPRPRMVWVQVWKNGVEVRRQVPEPSGENVPVGVAVTLPSDVYLKLQEYCKNYEIAGESAILQIAMAALLRHERYASAA